MMETDWHVVRILQGIHYRIIVAIIISSTWMNIVGHFHPLTIR